MTKELHKKKDGFIGQKALVLPGSVIKKNETDPLLQNLMITDIGYYPKASEHYRARPKGVDQHIFIYCVDGKGWCKIEGKEYTVKNDEFMIIPANRSHVYGADRNNPWSIFWMHIKGSSSAAIVHELFERIEKSNNHVQYSEKRMAVFNELYNNMERGAAKQNLAFISLSIGYFLASFLYQECFSINESSYSDRRNPVEDSISFMRQKTESLLSLKELAENVNLSVSHYSSLFKNHTGYSPIDYFNHLKMQQACQWLQFTSLNINEISFRLGIEDVFYFSRLFKKTMGTSPKYYRQKWQS